ncbi:peptidylprolyl isomerase [Alteraurantiacibacter aquimixticola]|uniref:Parvulin-like PPIase n=1 Tax=Alteraurantiacibacter aquimixticola TaxID=2489173 RepID=A0A4T3F7B0_9SPHN|nr:peptidylprolyl isomerase [Alteraurantiacibacter aquimixticola]TIX51592.1 peptidylprolyl isomerase [Alteraurantiacibacter aquimixticola]
MTTVNLFAKTLRIAAATAALAAITAPAVAQNDGFDIPEDFNFLSTENPNVRRATARVNGNIITGTDVDHRVALIVAANESPIPPEEMDRLRLQVLRNLIDETLQVQEAAALEMEVSAEEVDQAYERFAAERFDRGVEQMDEYLRSVGSSPRTLKRQIQGELAWDRLLRRNVAPFVNVSTEEVNELFDRLEASRGQYEYRIGEIFLSATPATRDAVLSNADQIVQQLRQGGSFVAYARQYSDASTRAVGGDLGWIQLAQLQNPQLETAARDMVPGQLAGPIEIPGGFSLLLLIDRRQIGMADPRDAVLSLKQISLDFAPGMPEAEAQQRADLFATTVTQMNGCGDVDAKAAAIGAQVVANDQIRARALPDALQAALLELNVGQATPPFGDLQEGVRVLMLCGRDDPQQVSGPDFDDLMSNLENERINRRAQRYLRDLRRDAVIEYN